MKHYFSCLIKGFASLSLALILDLDAISQNKCPEKFAGNVPAGCKVNQFDGYSIIGNSHSQSYQAGIIMVVDGESNIILQGEYGYSDRLTSWIVDGSYYEKNESGWNETIGSFWVSNDGAVGLVANKKKAAGLSINPLEISAFDGVYKGRRMIYDSGRLESLLLESSPGSSTLSGYRLSLDVHFTVKGLQELLSSIDFSTMNGESSFSDGRRFVGQVGVKDDGKVLSLLTGNIYNADGTVASELELDKITMYPRDGELFCNPEKVIYERRRGDVFNDYLSVMSFCRNRIGKYDLKEEIHVECKYDWEHQNLSYLRLSPSELSAQTSPETKLRDVELTMEDGSIDAYMTVSGFCGISEARITVADTFPVKSFPLDGIFKYADSGQFIMNDGSSYDGMYKMSSNDEIVFSTGSFTFSNADVFTGDMQSEKKFGIPTGGSYVLKGGEIVNADFFANAHVEDRHVSLLEDCKTPSDIYDKIKFLSGVYSSLKKYDGPFRYGRAIYYYYEEDGARVYDGPFHFICADTATDVKGDFSVGKRTGMWTFSQREYKMTVNYLNGYHHGKLEFKGGKYNFSATLDMNVYDGEVKYGCYDGDVSGQFDKGRMVGIWRCEGNLSSIVYDFTGSEVVHYQLRKDTGQKSTIHNKPDPDPIHDMQVIESNGDPSTNYYGPITYYRLPEFKFRD